MAQSYVRVLGSADWQPTAGNDHSCYTVCDQILIDACPSVVTNLLGQGVDPINVSTICFTHMHADHYMGLAPLLLYWRVRMASLGGLTIIGPKATVRAGFERALNFVFHDSRDLSAKIRQMPKIIELEGAATCEVSGFRFNVMDSDHAVPGLCYRIEDASTGTSVGFTGDTRYLDAFGGFFREVNLLVHEVSFGAGPLDEKVNAACRHSSAREAVRVAAESNARALLLTHTYGSKRADALAYARSALSIPVEWAEPGKVFAL